MFKKEIFIQYEDIQKEIKNIEKRIIVLENNTVIDCVKMSGDFPYSLHNTIIEGIDNNLYYKYINKLRNRQKNLLELKNTILEFVDNIEDSKIRQIFMYRYIDNMEWFKIANLMGYSGESAVRMKHDRYLKKI